MEAGNEQGSGAKTSVSDVVYSPEKDFYKGMGGEFRFKAEGLFKKAREKGISIEEIDVEVLKEDEAELPGIGNISLPAYMVRVRGRHAASGQVIVDGKQIDYYNRYQKYVAEGIMAKNTVRDENGRSVREKGTKRIKSDIEFQLTEWERFQIGRELLEDKEFGLEKTITGACDRVIRKLMGENDWLHPEEARLLDEEFESLQEKAWIAKSQSVEGTPVKKATERQINYLKAKIKNAGLDPDNETVTGEIVKQLGFDSMRFSDMSTADMSKIIDGLGAVLPKVKEQLERKADMGLTDAAGQAADMGKSVRQ